MREQTMQLPYLPRRVTAAREAIGLKQAELADKLGFNDRQTLAAIEAGERRLSAEELVRLVDVTGCGLDFFTDPFRLIGEGAFSYRAAKVDEQALSNFESQVGGWIALWRHLSHRKQVVANPLRFKLAIDHSSTFEQAQAAGEGVAQELKLGPVPASGLAEALEERLDLLVLHVDMPAGVSGAAVQVRDGESILVNRRECPGRQAFDLAHELFHVLTWDALPPERVDRENPSSYKQKRTEQLADNFAGALLMPSEELLRKWDRQPKDNGSTEALTMLGEHFGVSAIAAAWRLVALGRLKKDDIPQELVVGAARNGTLRAKYSRRFLERIVWGIEKGEVSLLRVLKVLGTELETFKEDCAKQGVAFETGL